MSVVDYQAEPLLSIACARGLLDPRRAALLRLTTLPIACSIDRSGTLDFGVKVKVLDPLPRVDPAFDKPFAQLMRERAAALIAKGVRLAVYWSGGMDSTGALTALLEAGISAEQLLVVYTTNSIVEYPLFHERYVAPLPPSSRCLLPSSFLKSTRPEGLMVTGELGDQTFGSILIRMYEESGDYAVCLRLPWRSHVVRKYPRGTWAALLDMYEPFVARAPFAIENAYDFLWWINFAVKWQHVVMRIAQGANDVNAYMSGVRHFYRTEDFQQWSMNEHNHRTQKTGAAYNTYKLALRRYIEAFTRDADYARHKQKIGSLPLKFGTRYVMVLDTGERVRCGGHASDDPAAYAEKYGSRFDHLFSAEEQCVV